jgi:hypothetical protein
VATKSLEFPELAFYVSQPLFEQRFLSLEQDATAISVIMARSISVIIVYELRPNHAYLVT